MVEDCNAKYYHNTSNSNQNNINVNIINNTPINNTNNVSLQPPPNPPVAPIQYYAANQTPYSQPGLPQYNVSPPPLPQQHFPMYPPPPQHQQ
eukprot:gene1003-1273_t